MFNILIGIYLYQTLNNTIMRTLKNNLQLKAMLIAAIILGAAFTAQILINGFKPF